MTQGGPIPFFMKWGILILTLGFLGIIFFAYSFGSGSQQPTGQIIVGSQPLLYIFIIVLIVLGLVSTKLK